MACALDALSMACITRHWEFDTQLDPQIDMDLTRTLCLWRACQFLVLGRGPKSTLAHRKDRTFSMQNGQWAACVRLAVCVLHLEGAKGPSDTVHKCGVQKYVIEKQV